MSQDDSITITLVDTASDQSESLPLSTTTKVSELIEWAKALLNIDRDIQLVKDGRPIIITTPTTTLAQAGIQNGDVLSVSTVTRQLDFSNLLASTATAAAAPIRTTTTTTESNPSTVVYYPGMSLDDAMAYNHHPRAFVTVVRANEHLWKELNYHNPKLAIKLQQAGSIDAAEQIWRSELVQGSIQAALRQTTQFHQQQDMQRRKEQNPNDPQVMEFFRQQERRQNVQAQYEQMMTEYPESLGRVLMLYIDAKINGHAIQPFCDSGAQMTIMSEKLAKECGLEDYIDTRFAGTAVGVGTGKILGRIHIVQLQIGNYFFPCSVTVMASNHNEGQQGKPEAATGRDMPFLLGLDMMKRHTCQIDLEKGVLKFRIAPSQYMETPFLHEKDLDETQGGTKGFNALKANQDLLEKDQDKDME